jgi:hypothetical protein
MFIPSNLHDHSGALKDLMCSGFRDAVNPDPDEMLTLKGFY